MFSQQGLSLEQAPPIFVVLRFFFAGSLFGVMAGIALLFYREEIFDPSSVAAVTFTHILTLGVMLSFMFGALFQMLPVIAGVVLSTPVQKANFVQYPMIVGTLMLLWAFNFDAQSWIYAVAALLLGLSILYASGIMLQALIKLPNHSASSKGMTAALAALSIAVLLALYLVLIRGGYLDGSHYLAAKEAHYSLALFGWIGVLIISISFQVIEMFYVTPPYPPAASRTLAFVILGLLVFFGILAFAYPQLRPLKESLMALLLIVYALITLRRLSQRKRPITDATVWFWRIGMGSLVLSMLMLFVRQFISTEWIVGTSAILYAAFALSVVFAMFYKIVPFLTWFHLNSQGYFAAPMMHEVIHPKIAKRHLWIHLATLVCLLLSQAFAPLTLVAALLMIFSFGQMSYLILHARRVYIKTQKEGERFDMGA